MDFTGSVFLLIGFCIAGFWILYKKNKVITKINGSGKENILILEEESNRRKGILTRIETFLKSSQFIEPIAKWREERIYRYILNNGYLYEFDEIMSPDNQRIGIDEDFLCFKQLTYKRVNNPQEFLENFKDINANLVS